MERDLEELELEVPVSTQLRLSELLPVIANELLQAQENARKSGNAVMQFAECAIEFAVEVEKEGGGGVNFWILELKGGVRKTDKNTITVTFSAIPGRPIQTMR